MLQLDVVANIGDSSPRQALSRWLDVVWEEGGGSPTLPIALQRDDSGTVSERLLFPSLVCVRLLSVDKICCVLTYEVSNPGLATYQVQSHLATVAFARNEESELEMLWSVRVQPLAGWTGIVKAFTAWSIEGLARSFQVPRRPRVGLYQLPDPDEDPGGYSYGTPSGFRSRWRVVDS